MQKTGTLLIAAVASLGVASAAPAEPVKLIHAPARAEAPALVEAVMLNVAVSLSEAANLSSTLVETGVEQGEAASAAALAQAHVNDQEACLVKLSLSRDPESGAMILYRMVLSTAATQTVIEKRSGALRVISTGAKRLRTV